MQWRQGRRPKVDHIPSLRVSLVNHRHSEWWSRCPPCSETKNASESASYRSRLRWSEYWRNTSAAVVWSGTIRDLPNFVSRMIRCGGSAFNLTSSTVNRIASPTLSPVAANIPIRVESVCGRNESAGPLARAEAMSRSISSGEKMYGLGRRAEVTSPRSGTSVSGIVARKCDRNLRAMLNRAACPELPRDVQYEQAHSIAM
jgi:hypothetical protein